MKIFLMVPIMSIVELLADWSLCASTGLDQRALPVQQAFHYTFYNRYINSDMSQPYSTISIDQLTWLRRTASRQSQTSVLPQLGGRLSARQHDDERR